jgi:hypothetical protein
MEACCRPSLGPLWAWEKAIAEATTVRRCGWFFAEVPGQSDIHALHREASSGGPQPLCHCCLQRKAFPLFFRCIISRISLVRAAGRSVQVMPCAVVRADPRRIIHVARVPLSTCGIPFNGATTYRIIIDSTDQLKEPQCCRHG